MNFTIFDAVITSWKRQSKTAHTAYLESNESTYRLMRQTQSEELKSCAEQLEKSVIEFKKSINALLGSKGTVDIIYNFNQPEIKKQIDCELLGIYKDGKIVVQCYDIHGEKWESETFSRIEFFTPKN